MPATLAGETYKSVRNSDGTHDIFDVPVFAFVPEGTKGAPEDIGEQWMQGAIKEARRREKEDGWKPPLHTRHHGASETAFAGTFRVTRVRTKRYDGKSQPVLFADLLNIPADIFKEIMAGMWAARSVEIIDYEAGVINTLALLDTEEPFFRFPNLSNETIESFSLRSFERSGAGYTAIFSCKEATDVEYTLRAVEGKPVLYAGTEPVDAVKLVIGDGFAALFEGDDDKKDDMKDLKAQLTKLRAENADLKAKLHAYENDDEDKKDKLNVDDKPDSEPANPSKAKAKAAADTAGAAQFAAMAGEVSALKDRLDKNDKVQQVKGIAAQCKADLEAKGFHISPDREKDIANFAARGAEALADWQASFERNSIPDPIDPDRMTATQMTAADAPEVAAYSTHGPDALEEARVAAGEHAEIMAANPRFGSSLKQYLGSRIGKAVA